MAVAGISKGLLGLVDIAVNLTDTVFRGVDYKGKRLHDDDFHLVLERASAAGVDKIFITGTSYQQSIAAIQMCREHPDRLRCTVGVHPAHCCDFEKPSDANSSPTLWAEQHLGDLVRLIKENSDVVVAVGEIGLDYAELGCCPRDVQETYFKRQLTAYMELHLPFLFHSRDCGMRFVELLQEWMDTVGLKKVKGVVHSFNGTPEEQTKLLAMGLHLSVNGSAFRTAELARQVISIPMDRLLFETDAPWCDIRKKDFGYQFVQTHPETNKKGKAFVMGRCLERRNEPCHLLQIVEAYLGTRKVFGAPEIQPAALVEQLRSNCLSLFAWDI